MLLELQPTVKPRILVVDDEPRWVRVLALYLRGRQCEVTTALDGCEALQRIDEIKPDLIIADIAMPGMDGFELCRHLRRDAATRTIPFIFLTARDHETERMKAHRIGADDYLTKPCSLDRVVQSVETAMERIQQARTLSLDRIGTSGRIEDIDLLDLIQALELEQRTGALVLSHGDRTGTLYLQDGLIVEAEIRSPMREEPLFRLLGWKTGRFVFISDAVPERMPITASMAHLLFEDLQLLEDHEQAFMEQSSDLSATAQPIVDSTPIGRILGHFETIAGRVAAARLHATEPLVLRVLIAGTTTTSANDLIQGLVLDLSPSKWAALETPESHLSSRQDIGRVRLSSKTALHLAVVRGEKRFWPVWEQCFPGAVGAVVVLAEFSETQQSNLRSFLSAREIIAPGMPVMVSVPDTEWKDRIAAAQRRGGIAGKLPQISASDIVVGAITEQPVRLELLSRLLERRLALDSE